MGGEGRFGGGGRGAAGLVALGEGKGFMQLALQLPRRAVAPAGRGQLQLACNAVPNPVASPHSCGHRPAQELWPSCSLVFDAGRLDAGRSGSTVIDLTTPGEFVIRRRGSGFARTMQLLQEKHGLKHVL